MKSKRKATVKPNENKSIRRGVSRTGGNGRAKKTGPSQTKKKGAHSAADILERISDGFVAFDADMNYTYVNKRGGEMLGRKPEELIGKNYWKEYPEAKGTPFANAYVRALETQTPILFEDYYAPFERWFENRIYPSKDGLAIFFTEITERKRAEEELRASQRNLRALIDNTDGMIFAADREYKLIVANKKFEEEANQLIGHLGKPGELAIDNPQLSEEVRKAWKARYDRALRGEHFSVELERKAAPQSQWLQYWYSPIADESGEITGFTSFARDITARKRVENALWESEQKFSVIFKKAPFAAALSRLPDGAIVEVNEEFEGVFGYARQDVIGRTSVELGMYPDPDERIRTAAKVQEQGFVRNAEMKLRTKSGNLRDFLVNTDFVEIGKEKHVLTTAKDITESKEAEGELRLHRDRLAELSRRLVEAHETEQRAIGRELHDQIGQMLTALKLTLDIAAQLPAEEAAQKFVTAQELVDDLMSRVSRLSLELRPPMLDDLGLIPALLWHITRHQEQTGIEIDFKHGNVEGKRFDPEIETTAYRIVQESLTNVARHAQATRVRLEVRGGGGMIEIQIEDNGQGFDPDIALAKNRGLGGMRERVNLLGGTFQIESQVGAGTKKLIRLPIQEKIP